eukprot:2534518-Amphidinium_carterae.1
MKTGFQHGLDEAEKMVFNKAIKDDETVNQAKEECPLGMAMLSYWKATACATGQAECFSMYARFGQEIVASNGGWIMAMASGWPLYRFLSKQADRVRRH